MLSVTKEAAKALKSRGVKLEGCSEAEIQEIMQAQKIEYLPPVYRELLETIGKSGIEIILDGACLYSDLKDPDMKASLISQLAAININLSPKTFAFFDHHGYIYYWFNTENCEPDPAVYGWGDDSDIKKLADSISEFFLQKLDKLFHIFWNPKPTVFS